VHVPGGSLFKKYCVFKRIGGKGRAMRHRIASYIAKYIGKDADAATFNKERYWTSRGIVVPEVEPYMHLGPESNARAAAVAAHECVLSHGETCVGAQYFWNQGIEVFWIASGNIT